MNSRIAFIIVGTLFFLNIGIIIFLYTVTGRMSLSENIPLIVMALSILSIFYLKSQFKKEDERYKFIREKAMFFSYVAVLAYNIILMVVLQYNIVTLAALEVVQILAALTLITVFISMVVLSKIY